MKRNLTTWSMARGWLSCRNPVRLMMLVALALGASNPAFAQLPDGPGKDLIFKVCGSCHQAERSASVRLTREGWEGVIADMIKRGAKGTDEEFGTILDYLETHFLGEASRPLNINRATNIELESVAGLTRKEAAAVLAYLDKVGICKSIDELKKVAGLDYKKIDARKDFIVCFEAPPPPKEPKEATATRRAPPFTLTAPSTETRKPAASR